MKNVIKIAIAISILVGVNLKADENKLSYGIGIGALYNGIGANIALPKQNSMTYLAVGCVSLEYSDYNDQWDSSCGFGLGYIDTSILSNKNNKHGLGVFLGATYNSSKEKDEELTLGLGYTYFSNGISNRGWNFGLTPAIKFYKNGKDAILLLDIGYQF